MPTYKKDDPEAKPFEDLRLENERTTERVRRERRERLEKEAAAAPAAKVEDDE